MKPIILEYLDKKDSVCSFWRGRGPLAELARKGELEIIEAAWQDGVGYNEDWTTMRMCNIAFFQRPMAKRCLQQVMMCKDMGLKIWVDLDDFNEIPPHHPVYNLYVEDYDDDYFWKIMMLADIVTVSTKVLQEHYLTYTNKVKILPNAINDHILRFVKRSQMKALVWRGGDHHLTDLYTYRKPIIEILKEYKDWYLYGFGFNPHFFKKIKNYQYIGNLSIHDYFGAIINLNPLIFLIPLLDNDLNRGKSNISWQEATLAGANALVPNWWKMHRYAASYKDENTFYLQLKQLIENKKYRDDLYEKSLDKMKKDFLLSEVNKQRLQIIKSLIT